MARDILHGRCVQGHCGRSFISWQNLIRYHYHTETRSCLHFAAKAPPKVLDQHRQRPLDIFDAGDLQLLRRIYRCVLCGHWASKTQQMSAHAGKEHPEAQRRIPNITRARAILPCRFCGLEFRSKTAAGLHRLHQHMSLMHPHTF